MDGLKKLLIYALKTSKKTLIREKVLTTATAIN